jgi:hypothetical protein
MQRPEFRGNFVFQIAFASNSLYGLQASSNPKRLPDWSPIRQQAGWHWHAIDAALHFHAANLDGWRGIAEAGMQHRENARRGSHKECIGRQVLGDGGGIKLETLFGRLAGKSGCRAAGKAKVTK